MRKLVFILIAFLAAVTFIRALALDNQSPGLSGTAAVPVEMPGGGAPPVNGAF
jgi:hypothetical protein